MNRAEYPGLEQSTQEGSKVPGDHTWSERYEMRPSVPSGSVLQQWWQEGLGPLPVLVQSFCNPRLPLPVLVHSGLLPQPTPTGARIWKDVISGGLRDACLGLTLIIPS